MPAVFSTHSAACLQAGRPTVRNGAYVPFAIDYSPNGTLTTATFGVSTNNRPAFGLNIGAAVAALEQSGQAKILARPRILVLNNRPAAILSGEAVPIFTSVVVPDGTGTIVTCRFPATRRAHGRDVYKAAGRSV